MRFACIATGPSLTRADCDRARSICDRVIAVNDAYTICPDADYLYACDPAWWRVHHAATETFRGQRWTQRQERRPDAEEIAVTTEYGLQWVVGRDGHGLGREMMHYGSTSGYQAINLAYLWGAKRIILLGYDYQVGYKKHFFGDHPKGLQVASRWPEFAKNLDALAAGLESAGVEVINCSRATALRCFPRSTMDDI